MDFTARLLHGASAAAQPIGQTLQVCDVTVDFGPGFQLAFVGVLIRKSVPLSIIPFYLYNLYHL